MSQSLQLPLAAPETARRRGPGVVLGIVLSLALVVAGVVWVVALAVRQDERSTTNLAAPFDRLVIEADAGDVVVRATTSDEATIEQRLRWSFVKPSVTATVVDGVLRVAGDCRNEGVLPGPGCSVDFVLYVPLDTAVEVDSGSGDVAVEGIRGDLVTRTGSGDISVAEGAGSVEARTGSGDIELEELNASAVIANAGSGDIRVTFGSDPDSVTARAGSGDVDILFPRGEVAFLVEADTGSGDRQVDIRTDPSSSRTITASTGSGDLVIGYR